MQVLLHICIPLCFFLLRFLLMLFLLCQIHIHVAIDHVLYWRFSDFQEKQKPFVATQASCRKNKRAKKKTFETIETDEVTCIARTTVREVVKTKDAEVHADAGMTPPPSCLRRSGQSPLHCGYLSPPLTPF